MSELIIKGNRERANIYVARILEKIVDQSARSISPRI